MNKSWRDILAEKPAPRAYFLPEDIKKKIDSIFSDGVTTYKELSNDIGITWFQLYNVIHERSGCSKKSFIKIMEYFE